MNKYYHKKHKKYFEKLKNQTSHCPNQNTHCVFVSDFSSNCTQSTEFIETESIECQNSITEYIAENSSKEIKYKSKQEADEDGRVFIEYLKKRANNVDDPWIYFSQEDPNFQLLMTTIKGSLGNLNFVTLLLLVFAFIVYVRLPSNHLEDLLSLLIVVLPHEICTNFPNNLYQFNLIFDSILRPKFRRLSYCVNCCLKFGAHGINCNEYKEGHFILFDIQSVIEHKLKSKDFCKDLLHGILDTRLCNNERLTKITDGRIHREFRKYLNILYPLSTITFGLFIDAVNTFKSSKNTIIPSIINFIKFTNILLVYLVINEIDLSMRYQLHNLILLGLIVQYKKPTYGILLMEMIEMLQQNFLKGFELKIDDKTTIHFRSLLTNILIDIGERSNILNINTGGYFGCHLCETIGKYCGGAVHYLDEDPIPRTFKSFRESAEKASQLSDENPGCLINVKGIFGLSAFSILPFLFIPR